MKFSFSEDFYIPQRQIEIYRNFENGAQNPPTEVHSYKNAILFWNDDEKYSVRGSCGMYKNWCIL